MIFPTTGYAKLTRPDVSGIAPRIRLIELLENVTQQVIWISCPGGSGKTTLVASYLEARKLPCIWYEMDEADSDPATFFHYMGIAAKSYSPVKTPSLPAMTPEYLQHGIRLFAKNYFENLFSRIASKSSNKKRPTGKQLRPFHIILDNYQVIAPESELHEVINSCISLVTEGIKVIILSRNGPPPSFAKHDTSKSFFLIGWDEIRFTFEESKAIINSEMQKGLVERALKDIYEKSQGWAAGMILMFEKARFENILPISLENMASEGIFDFFAGDLLDRVDKEIRIFLLKTAFLPDINIRLAEKITGLKNGEYILSELNRHNFFTEKLSGIRQDFKYHPLFKTFLLKRSQHEFSTEELYSIKREIAFILEQSGQPENAAKLFSDASDWENLARIIIHNARAFLMQGRNKTIEEWISYIPADIFEDNPWLIYWRGICAFPYNMVRNRELLESAFESFIKNEDTAGMYLSWAGIVDSFVFELDAWKHLDRYIEILDDLLRRYPSCPSADIDLIVSSRMLISLTLRKTDQPDWVNEWYGRVCRLLDEKPSLDIQMDTLFCMSLYYLWTGEYNKNAVLLEKADAEILVKKPTPFSVIRIKLMKGIHCWITAQYDSALDTLSEGLEISKKNGVHVFDSLLWSFRAASEMARCKMEIAEESLKNQLLSLLDMSKTLDIFFYHINSAWYEILKGNPSLAAENMAAISARVLKMGTPYYTALWNIGMAQIAFMQDRPDEAKKHVQTAHGISVRMKSHILEWNSLLIDAYIDFMEGNEHQGITKLGNGLRIGRQHGYIHLEFYQPAVKQFLYAKALEAGIENEYVTALIKKLGLTPPDSAFYIEEWPWQVKIFTMGRFEIIINDQPLMFSGKEPKKPVEMLKVIIALGGRNVPEEKITDALWPDASGDLAFKSFETNLGRLRRILGRNHLVRYTAGQLSLDKDCWVDSLVFGDIYQKTKKTPSCQISFLFEKAMELYKGKFLPSDSNLHWALSRREVLNNYHLRIIFSAGQNHEQNSEWQKAVDCYLIGLDSDSLVEEFYQRLIICYQKLGRHAEAVRTYNLCRRVLHENLGLPPSSETNSIHLSLFPKK